MTSVALPFALPWIVFAAVWAGLCFVSIVMARATRPMLARIDPTQRSTLLFAFALLPLIVASLVTALGFLPKIGGLLVDPHCHPDVGCVAHIPILHTTVAHATVLSSLLLVATGSLLWSIGGRLRRSVALTTTLASLAQRTERESFKVVESRARFAYCVGLLRPQLLVSRGVLELPAQQRDAVIAHEIAHAARRDNLRRWLASVSLWPLPKRAQTALLADLGRANELACDRAACKTLGVASLATALAALASPAESQAGGEVASRLRALSEARLKPLPSALVGAFIASLYILCALVALVAAHHGSELVLDWLG